VSLSRPERFGIYSGVPPWVVPSFKWHARAAIDGKPLLASSFLTITPNDHLRPGRRVAMMLDWNNYRAQVLAGVGEIARLSPDTVKGYVGLGSAGQKKDLLGAKTRELIALAVAVTVRCDGCIAVHTDAAIKNGASKDEIAEALGVAIAVNAGAALVYSTRVMDAFGTHDAP
jgi:AhpD family alkylhydroperoxidase